MQYELLSGVLNTIEKVGVSKLMSNHTQIRKGRRPYRVSTLLKKDTTPMDIPDLLEDVSDKTATKDYGPAGKWVHDRAHRIMEDSPETPKHIAYAIATQQGHKIGKSPKDFRTPQGVQEAKAKYDAPKSEYQKTAGEKLAVSIGLLTRARDAAIERARQKAKEIGFKGMKGSVPEYLKKVAPKAVQQAETFSTAIAKKKKEGIKALGAVEPELRQQMRKAASLTGFFDELDKISGVGVDLRLLRKSGVTKIQMPTEESLAQAKSKLMRTQRVGGDLKIKPPDPNIRAVATKPK